MDRRRSRDRRINPRLWLSYRSPPQILFERHIFRKYTNGRFDSDAPEISGAPGAYGLLSEQYNKRTKGLALCAKAKLSVEPALQSASWGMGQVMGFNYDVARYKSAANMIQAMVRNEDAQLASMAGYLRANGLADKLIKKDWTAFAKGYNGSSYWQNRYDVKLAEQYQRFASGSLPNLEMRTAQVALLFLGYASGKIDGVIGPRTRAAIKNFRIAAGLAAGEELDGLTYQALCKKAGIRP